MERPHLSGNLLSDFLTQLHEEDRIKYEQRRQEISIIDNSSIRDRLAMELLMEKFLSPTAKVQAQIQDAAKHAQYMAEAMGYYYADHGLTRDRARVISSQFRLLALQLTAVNSLHSLKLLYTATTLFLDSISIFQHRERKYSIEHGMRQGILNRINDCISKPENFQSHIDLSTVNRRASSELSNDEVEEVVESARQLTRSLHKNQELLGATCPKVEEAVKAIDLFANPSSERYGRLLSWQNPPDPFWHYGIGLSDTHIFDTGQGLRVFERENAGLVEGIDDIAFEPERAIARLKHALHVFSEWEYTLTGWNCEHLSRLVATDRPRCYQSSVLWWMCNLTPEGDHKTARQVLLNHLTRVDPSLTR
ncbi:hypothetical protein KR51_00016210 [Rubidibacter lacunae KORDI 51-2]|uniref:Uncharacterized protein n=1 Tax=Rubidibacter lacunae KORDI 51-2 TaxID=582515 RepID=U5DJA0_9CHRO|nr:hypothetical protein [Rubidibacter lacunae]ERN41771.1 hypothetical protein KR51_00016210 [Rubidibacter lacunae KORDI 51-2]